MNKKSKKLKKRNLKVTNKIAIRKYKNDNKKKDSKLDKIMYIYLGQRVYLL